MITRTTFSKFCPRDWCPHFFKVEIQTNLWCKQMVGENLGSVSWSNIAIIRGQEWMTLFAKHKSHIFLAPHQEIDIQCDKLGWRKINRSFYTSTQVASHHQQMGPTSIWPHKLSQFGTTRQRKHTFWQLISGNSCVPGICQQINQCFSKLRVSGKANNLLGVKERLH